MTWQILLAISIVSISIANLYQRIAMKEEDSDPFAGAIIFQLLITFFTGFFAISKGINIPPLDLLGYFAISTIFYGLGTLSYFNAIKLIEASESTILASIGSIVTVISAYFFLGERLNQNQFIGVGFILISVILIAFKKNMTFNRGTLFSILGTTFYGLAVTNDVYILRSFDAISYTPIISLLPGLFLIAIKPSAIKSVIKAISKPAIKPLLLYCVFYSVQAITYYAALERGALASQMTMLYKLEIFLTVLLAAIFLHETDNLPKKIVSTILAFIGVYFLV